jgi:membrane-associated HD superfamily phosphohydrolase
MSENLTELQDENITNQINEMVAQVNSTLEQSSQQLLCGPDCQAQQNRDNLRQIYLDAELNLQTAPTKLTVAEKNYLISTLGEAGYSDYMTTKLTVQANQIGDKIETSFRKVAASSSTLNNLYETLYNNYDYLEDLYDNYSTVNISLKKDINLATGDVVTSDRKTYYETQNLTYLKNWYTIYKFIYIAIIIIFIIFLFVRRSEYSRVSRFFILIFFILYPIYITQSVFWIWNNVILRIWELLPSNIYKSI